MTLEQLQEMQKKVSTIKVKGKAYAMVNERVKALRSEIPNALIETEIVHLEGKSVIVKATVYDEDGRKLGTGHAEEKEGSSNINNTSYIENCETSAVGRALGMCGIGIEASFASADEVANATKQQWEIEKKKEIITPDEAELFRILCEKKGREPKEGYENMTAETYAKAIRELLGNE